MIILLILGDLFISGVIEEDVDRVYFFEGEVNNFFVMFFFGKVVSDEVVFGI